MSGLFESAIKVTVIVSFALMAAFVLRRRSAALRHWALAIGVSCAALMPALTFVLPTWRPAITLTLTMPAEAMGQPTSDALTPAGSTASSSVAGSEPTRRTGGKLSRRSPITWAAILWMTGLGFGIARIFLGFARLRLLTGGARRILSGVWPALAAEISRAYGLRRTVRVLHSDHPSVLATWGLVRPVVILPQSALEWSEDRARIVIGHELAHVLRGDWLAQLAAELLRAIYWFNPLMWMMARRLRDESERACDDVVLNSGVDGSTYAAELVGIARTLKGSGMQWLLAPAMARASSLGGRVEAMLDSGVNRLPLRKSTRLVTATVLAALAVILAGLTVAAQTFSSFSGLTLDQLGGSVANVRLALTNRETGQKYEVRSNALGAFEFVGLASGEYDLETVMAGFRSAKGRLSVSGRNIRQDVQLQVGSLEETLSVYGGPAAATGSQTPTVRVGTVPEKAECVVRPTGGGIVPPRKIANANPVYPANLNAAKVGGTITLNALIGADGTMKEVVGADATAHPDLVNAVIDAVKLWQFTPTLLNCVPIEVEMKVTAHFSIP